MQEPASSSPLDDLDLREATVAISGRFSDWSKAELEILLKSRGAWQVSKSPAKGCRALFSADAAGKKVDKARSLGVPVVLPEQVRSVLGAPLGGYRNRLAAHIEARSSYYRNHTLALGEPASDAMLARVEDRIGFSLPEDARALWSQLDGLSWLWTVDHDSTKTTTTSTEPLAWTEACDADGALWRSLYAAQEKQKNFLMGLCCIPPVETIFFTKWNGMLFDGSGYGPRDKLRLGKRKVNASSFFDNLFLFDLFSPYYWAGLWADPEREALFVVYGSDHGAAWDVAAEIPLEIYMESLLVEDARERPITLTSKLGATTSMINYAHKPYWVLDPYRRG